MYARSLAIFTSTYAVAINSLLRLISAYRKAIIEPLPRAVGESSSTIPRDTSRRSRWRTSTVHLEEEKNEENKANYSFGETALQRMILIP